MNLDIGIFEEKCNTVLIDTWWNVNKIKELVITQIKRVLIDTWWNVNYHP